MYQRREFLRQAGGLVGAATVGLALPEALLAAVPGTTAPEAAGPVQASPGAPEPTAHWLLQARWTFWLRRNATDPIQPSLDHPRRFGVWVREAGNPHRCVGMEDQPLALAPGRCPLALGPNPTNDRSPWPLSELDGPPHGWRTLLDVHFDAITRWGLSLAPPGPVQERVRHLLATMRYYYHCASLALRPHEVTVWYAGRDLWISWDCTVPPGEEVGHVPAA